MKSIQAALTKPESKDQTLNELCSDLAQARKLNLEAIQELETYLTPNERENSSDTLSYLKMKAHLASEDYLLAYKEISASLGQTPYNLPLQLELNCLLKPLQDHFLRLLASGSKDPAVPFYYKVLSQEGMAGYQAHFMMAHYYLRTDNPSEAMKEVLKLIRIYPGMRGLPQLAETLVSRYPHPELNLYLRSRPEKKQIVCTRPELSAKEFGELMLRYRELLACFVLEDFSGAEKILKATVGDKIDESTANLNLKDFYFQKGVLELHKKNPLEAFHWFKYLVQIDPVNIYAQNQMDEAMDKAFINAHQLCLDGDFRKNLCEFFDLYRDHGASSFSLIAEVAKQHFTEGRAAKGRQLMDFLLDLNPVDNDYLTKCLEVAIFANDLAWQSELRTKVLEILAARPWDLKLEKLIAPAEDKKVEVA